MKLKKQSFNCKNKYGQMFNSHATSVRTSVINKTEVNNTTVIEAPKDEFKNEEWV